MKVADVMRKDLVTIAPETTLREAARLIFGSNMSGLPVVDKKGKLVGIVVEKDILLKFYPSQREYIEDYASFRDFDTMEEKITEVMNRPAKDFMSKNPVTTTPQTPLLRAGSLMMAKRVRRLPVIDAKKRLLGIISLSDVFRVLVRENFPPVTRGFPFFQALAPLYDRSFSWNERQKYEIPFLVKNFKKRGVKTVLDIGCGTGNHSLALAKAGFEVLGIDITNEMLKVCRQKLAELPEKIKENVEFLHLPVKEMATLKDKKFDAAILMGNAVTNFLHFEADILKINKILNPKATFVIHLKNFERILKEKTRFLSLYFAPGQDNGEKEYAFSKFYNHRQDGFLEMNIETLAHNGLRWRSLGVETTVQRPYLPKDLEKILKMVGFKKFQSVFPFGGKVASHEWLIMLATR